MKKGGGGLAVNEGVAVPWVKIYGQQVDRKLNLRRNKCIKQLIKQRSKRVLPLSSY